MNALEGRLKCVVFLTCRGEKGANNQAGFASKTIVGACQFVVIQKPVCLTPVQETISAHINQFCKAHGVSFMNYALDKSALIADSVSQLPHVSLHICSQDDLETLAECLLRHRSPSVLLVEIRCDSPISKDDVESAAGDEWDWLRPKQSCMAELRHEEWDNANELLPVTMWCAEPVIRSFPRSAELANETSIVTLDGLMRELGYKVGCLPKYGS
ncbi:hypothetical protein ERJ75_000351900 [Trypanosoma vivax]|uniref:Uncharacterized protein n=1 Tax=Trypanosoma vivax (strain Y486) TaxID=1055687 RepID=G0TZN5_TRYVY|nr:hypothetical protein ERJ75_000351900 [Trypanosoma vivax]CCC50063.1 conserved hypothetical protein [Trypanosoma vivax Y486]